MEKVAMTDFPSIAFQSSLGTEAILFGVFGFLYSVYGLYSSLANPKNPQRATIVDKLRVVCRAIAVGISFNAVITICSLAFMYLYSKDIGGLGNILLSIGIIVIILAIAGFTFVWAFWYLD